MNQQSKNQKTLFQFWRSNSNLSIKSDNSEASKKQDINKQSIEPIEEDDIDDLALIEASDRVLNETTGEKITLGIDDNKLLGTQYIETSGFDTQSGQIWIYPNNYPIRDYQYNIVQQCLYKNTMVVLPTGLGKTFVAAVVMFNFYRWYPNGKILFMAPTKPLVQQQAEACYKIMGIPKEDICQMTGSNMSPKERENLWSIKRVFFLTPQIIMNDILRGTVQVDLVKCVVIDEAHKALGDYAFCKTVQGIHETNKTFRVVALTATPGNDIKAIQEVINNLLISHIELRSDESIDIQKYNHDRQVDKFIMKLGGPLLEIKNSFIEVMKCPLKRLELNKVLFIRDPSSINKLQILDKREQFRRDPPQNFDSKKKGFVECDFAMIVSFIHGLELLMQYGIKSFYIFLKAFVEGEENSAQQTRMKNEVINNEAFHELYKRMKETFDTSNKPIPNNMRHPKLVKLEELILEHFRNKAEENTRVMIFSQYRESVFEIVECLNAHQPMIKVMEFVGQNTASGTRKAVTQKEQLQVVQKFRDGGYNILVSTCVGEEGLDIGEVDLIICYDAHKSPIRLIQRMGRTGRKRAGRIIILLTEGKEEASYNKSLASKKTIYKTILNGSKNLKFYQNNPLMLPKGHKPTCQKMFITLQEENKQQQEETPKNSKTKKRVSRGVKTNEDNVYGDKPFDQVEKPKKQRQTKKKVEKIGEEKVIEVETSVKKPPPIKEAKTQNVKNPPELKNLKIFNELTEDDIKKINIHNLLSEWDCGDEDDFLSIKNTSGNTSTRMDSDQIEKKYEKIYEDWISKLKIIDNEDSEDTSESFVEEQPPTDDYFFPEPIVDDYLLPPPHESPLSKPQIEVETHEESIINDTISINEPKEEQNYRAKDSQIITTSKFQVFTNNLADLFGDNEEEKHSSQASQLSKVNLSICDKIFEQIEVENSQKIKRIEDTSSTKKYSPILIKSRNTSTPLRRNIKNLTKQLSKVEESPPKQCNTQNPLNQTSFSLTGALKMINATCNTQPQFQTFFHQVDLNELFADEDPSEPKKQDEIPDIINETVNEEQEPAATFNHKVNLADLFTDSEQSPPHQPTHTANFGNRKVAIVKPFNASIECIDVENDYLIKKQLVTSDKNQSIVIDEPKNDSFKIEDTFFVAKKNKKILRDSSSSFENESELMEINNDTNPTSKAIHKHNNQSIITDESNISFKKTGSNLEDTFFVSKKKKKTSKDLSSSFENDENQNSFEINESITPKKPKSKYNNNQKKRKSPQGYVLDEAELSSDEYETDGDDDKSAEKENEYDLKDSFVDLEEHDVNESMMAFYKQSVRNGPRLAPLRPLRPITDDIFSQIPEPDGSYVYDSFVVHDSYEETRIEKPKKSKQKLAKSNKEPIKVKKSKIIKPLNDSSIVSLDDDDDEKQDFIMSNPKKRASIAAPPKVGKIIEEEDEDLDTDLIHQIEMIEEACKKAQTEEKSVKIESFSKEETSIVAESKKFLGPVWVIVDTSQINAASDIIRFLRQKTNEIKIHIESNLHCDFIVSQRCAVVRFKWSDLSSQSTRSTIIDKVNKAKLYFSLIIAVVEDDREITANKTRSKYFDFMLSGLTEHISVFFSKYKTNQTGQILYQIAKTEAQINYQIDIDCSYLKTNKQQHFQFYISLPDLSFINALYLCQNYNRLIDFCNSNVDSIKKYAKISDRKAKKIYNFLNA